MPVVSGNNTSHEDIAMPDYSDRAALENEIRAIAPHIDRRISTLYMGGGTPTVFSESISSDVFNSSEGKSESRISFALSRDCRIR